MSESAKILITGASRGLGAETAVAAAKLGARLMLTARNQEGLDETAERVAEFTGPDKVHILAGDLADPMFCQTLAGQTINWGKPGLDALILNAGQITPIGPIEDLDEENWCTAVEVNLTGPFRLMKRLLPALKKSRGRLITVGTGAATQPLPSWSAYCSSKAALLMLTQVVAVENPPVCAFSFIPGVIDTSMQETIRERASLMPSELSAYFTNLHQAGQLEPPEVPGRALAWCALNSPKEWSGEEILYSKPELQQQVSAAFNKIHTP